MAQVYRFIDENGQTRLMAEIDPAPGGGLPAEWTVGADGSLIINSTATGAAADVVFKLTNADGPQTVSQVFTSGDGRHTFNQDGANWLYTKAAGGDRPGDVVRVREYDTIFYNQGSTGHLLKIDRDNDQLGFFNHATSAQPVVPLTLPTVQNVIDALVALGLVAQHD